MLNDKFSTVTFPKIDYSNKVLLNLLSSQLDMTNDDLMSNELLDNIDYSMIIDDNEDKFRIEFASKR